jgi:putative transposase
VDVIETAHRQHQTLQKIWADGGHAGNCVVRVRDKTGIDLEIVHKTDGMSGEVWLKEGEQAPVSEGFKVLKWRWLIERACGWLGRWRRLSKDDEQSVASSLAWVRVALIGLLVRRMGAAQGSELLVVVTFWRRRTPPRRGARRSPGLAAAHLSDQQAQPRSTARKR